MSNDLPKEFQYLILFAALSDRVFTKSELGVKLATGEIDRLVSEHRLLEITKKGNSRLLQANGETRRWAELNLNVDLCGKNQAVLRILEQLRAKTAAFLKANEISLADFMKPAVIRDSPDPKAVIRHAYLALSAGEYGARVLLKDLRKGLRLSREAQDAVFMDLIRSGEADFYPEDDPMSRDAEDDQAALQLADRRRHVVYLHERPRT